MMKFITSTNKLHNSVILFTLLLLISSCSDQKAVDSASIKYENLKKEKEAKLKEEKELDRKEAKELSKGIKLAQNNKPEGLIRIYKVASTTISAENQEIAESTLRDHFLNKTDLWIKTFAAVDINKLKKNPVFTRATNHLVDDPDIPKDIRSTVINKLKFYSKKKETAALAKHILQINNLK